MERQERRTRLKLREPSRWYRAWVAKIPDERLDELAGALALLR
jgi:hypothetical protein